MSILGVMLKELAWAFNSERKRHFVKYFYFKKNVIKRSKILLRLNEKRLLKFNFGFKFNLIDEVHLLLLCFVLA